MASAMVLRLYPLKGEIKLKKCTCSLLTIQRKKTTYLIIFTIIYKVAPTAVAILFKGKGNICNEVWQLLALFSGCNCSLNLAGRVPSLYHPDGVKQQRRTPIVLN